MPKTYITTENYLPPSYHLESKKVSVTSVNAESALSTLKTNVDILHHQVVNCIPPVDQPLPASLKVNLDILETTPFTQQYWDVVLEDGDTIISIAPKGYNWHIATYHEQGIPYQGPGPASFRDVIKHNTPITSLYDIKSFLDTAITRIERIDTVDREILTCSDVLTGILGADDVLWETSSWYTAEQKGKLPHDSEEGIKTALRLIHSFVAKLEADLTLHSSILALTKDYVDTSKG